MHVYACFNIFSFEQNCFHLFSYFLSQLLNQKKKNFFMHTISKYQGNYSKIKKKLKQNFQEF